LLTEIPDSNYEVVVFDNRSPALRAPIGDWALPDLVGPDTDAGTAAGKCEVICFTDSHGGSFKDLSERQVLTLLEAWKDRTSELSKLPYIEHIAPFENRGEEVGVTLSHPHSQIYAYSYIPSRVEKMLSAAQDYQISTGKVLFDDVVAREIREGERVIAKNEHWVAFVPYAARYSFEIHVAPLKPVADLSELNDEASAAFPAIALEVTRRLDGVFGIEMAYIATWHQAPVREGRDLLRLHWQITSVRRAPGKLKYLAGSESSMGAFIMDLRPEQSAAQLREVKI
jgi:UDPglucose--hexose-1-phosphate uridylyltransferase